MENRPEKDWSEKLFDGEMSEEERQELIRKVKEDEDEADELAFQVALERALKKEREDRVTTILKEDATAEEPAESEEDQPPIPKSGFPLGMAAAALLLVGAFGLLYLFQNWKTNAYNTRELAAIQVDFANEPTTLSESSWKLLIKEKSFEAALTKIKATRLEEVQPCADAPLNYYGARLLMVLEKDYEQASNWLDCLNPQSASPVFPDVSAYQLKAFEASGNREEAKKIITIHPDLKTKYPEIFQ